MLDDVLQLYYDYEVNEMLLNGNDNVCYTE